MFSFLNSNIGEAHQYFQAEMFAIYGCVGKYFEKIPQPAMLDELWLSDNFTSTGIF